MADIEVANFGGDICFSHEMDLARFEDGLAVYECGICGVRSSYPVIDR